MGWFHGRTALYNACASQHARCQDSGAVALIYRHGIQPAADIFLVPLRDVPLFATFIPSKILEYLGARRPVSGEAERILREVAAAT